jgi:hypothetical protein
VEAWPTAPGLKLGVGVKKFKATGRAVIDTVRMVVPVSSSKGPLSTCLPENVILLRRQLFSPLFFGFFHSISHVNSNVKNVGERSLMNLSKISDVYLGGNSYF